MFDKVTRVVAYKRKKNIKVYKNLYFNWYDVYLCHYIY